MSIVRFMRAVLIIAKALVIITTNHRVYNPNPNLSSAYLTSGVFHALNI